MKKSLFGVLAVIGTLAAPAAALTYRADPAYSSAHVSLRHYCFFHPVAAFEKVQGAFDYEEGKPEVWKASVTVTTSSVNTGKPRLDRKLRSRRYLDAEAHPEITFVSEKTTVGKDGRVFMEGPLTIKGITHPARFEIEVDKPIEPRLDGTMGLSAHAVISRSLWKIPAGLTYGGEADVSVMLEAQPALP